MKKLSIIMGLLLTAAALSSCNMKEESSPADAIGARRFRAVLEQPVEYDATRAYADDDYKLFWNECDRLSVFYDYTDNREYEFDGLDAATAGDFDPVDPSQSYEGDAITTGFDYAIYPYNADNSCDSQGNLTVPIPAEQKYYNDKLGIGARPLLAARDKDDVLMFKHVGSYVGVRLKGDGVKVASISIKGNNSEILAGVLKVSFDSEGLPVSVFDAAYPSSEIITMNLAQPVELNTDDYTAFWFNLPEITFEKGLVITVTDVDGGFCTINKTAKLEFPRTYFRKTSANVEITSYPVSAVNVTPSTLALKPGETATLTAEVLPENAIDKTVTWSSDKPEIATVDENGKVTAVASGEAIITAAAGGKSGSCAVKVNDVITYELKINPEESEIAVGEILDFTYTLTRIVNGTPGDPSQVSNVTLSSSDDAIASVEEDTVEGIAAGTATITATYTPDDAEAVTATATITVKDVITHKLAISPTSSEINVGGSQVYTATLTTVKNGKSTTSTVTPTLSSSNTSVATVSGTTASGVASGTATITASFTPEGETVPVTATASLNVKDVYEYSLAVSPTSSEINVGGSQVYTATLTTIKNGGTPSTSPVTPTLTSSNTSVATVSGTTAIGKASGTATITASFTPEGASQAVTATASLNVKDVISYSLALTPSTADINVGGSQVYTATLTTVTNGTSATSTVTPTLTSSNTSVATVSGTTATGKAKGTATITASFTPQGASEAVTATATLNVKDVISYSLALTPSTANINVGGSQAYTATLTTVTNGTSATSTVTPTLTSSNTSVATVSGTTATGKASGTATITASFTPQGASEAVTATATLNVNDVTTYSLAISPAENAKVIIGKTLNFTLTLTTMLNGQPQESTVTTTNWTSSDDTIATVASGTATGIKEGEVTITAKYTAPDGTEFIISAPLTVTKDPNHAGDPIPIGEGENL